MAIFNPQFSIGIQKPWLGVSKRAICFAGPMTGKLDKRQVVMEAGLEGGYVFAPSHEVPRDVPPENLVAMMEVVRSTRHES
jgi:uroporphyrinogen-III decarboxylase